MSIEKVPIIQWVWWDQKIKQNTLLKRGDRDESKGARVARVGPGLQTAPIVLGNRMIFFMYPEKILF